MKRLFIFNIFALLASIITWAGVKIHGKIVDEDSEPMEFVTVRIAGTAIGTTSGLDGTYQLQAPDSDTIKVVFSCIGYHDANRQLINPEGDVTLNVQMRPSSISLGEVEVTDFRKQTDGMQKIEMDKFKLSPDVSGGSVEAMLTTMAGVNSNNEMSSQYSVRGGTYDENSVYINGIEVYRPQLISSGQQEGLSIINPDLVGAVGFSTGGFSSAYGDKMSSVLDITYREPEAFEGAASISLMGGNFSIGTRSKKFSMIHGVRYKSNSSLLSTMDEKGEYDPRFFDYQTNMGYRINNHWKVSLLGNIALNDYKFVPQTRTTSFGTSSDAKSFTVYFDGQEKDKFQTFFGALSLNYRPNRSSDFTLLASAYLTNELVTYDISGEYWLDQAGTTGGATGGEGVGGELGVGAYQEHARNRLKASVTSIALRGNTGISNHNISYGISYNHESIYDRSREWERRDSAGYSLPFDPSTLKLIYTLDSNHDIGTNKFVAFAEDNWRIASEYGYFNINAGLRFSYWDFNNEPLISPRASVGFVPDKAPRWAFRFATGLYYQQPFYKEFRMPVTDKDGNTIIYLNDKIKSQRSYQIIAGADYTFRAFDRPFKLSGEAYYKFLGNLIPYEIDNLKVVYSGVNTSSGFTTGIDMKLFGQFVPGSDSWISFSLMKTQEDLNGKKVPRPTDQRYSFSMFFTDYFPKFPKLKFSMRAILSDGLPMTAPHSSRDIAYFRAPAYRRLDIGFAYALLSPLKDGEHRSGALRHIKNVWLGLDVFNLLGISNVSSYYWVTDVNNIQYAVPNYLTGRQLNVRLSVEF